MGFEIALGIAKEIRENRKLKETKSNEDDKLLDEDIKKD